MIAPLRNLGTAASLLMLTPQAYRLVLDRIGLLNAPYKVRLGRDGIEFDLRPGKGDRDVFIETFVHGVYDYALDRLKTGGTVVDVGGNIGCFAVEARRRVGPTGRVVVAEPASECVEILRNHINNNKLSNIDLVESAISAEKGEVNLIVSEVTMFSSVYDRVDGRITGTRNEMVKSTTLNDAFEENNIDQCDLLKLDCEGSEYEIIDSMSPQLAALVSRLFSRHTTSPVKG